MKSGVEGHDGICVLGVGNGSGVMRMVSDQATFYTTFLTCLLCAVSEQIPSLEVASANKVI